MPVLRILTNLPRNKIPSDFGDKIIPLLSRVVEKPEVSFKCVIAPDCMISFGGDSTQPSATASLESIGHVTPERNRIVMKEVSDFVHREMGIKPSQFLLTFYDVDATNLGVDGAIIG